MLPSGAMPLGGARVTLRDSNGNQVGFGVTDGCGRFRVDGVAPGTYTLDYGVRTFQGKSTVVVGPTGAQTEVKVDAALLKIAVVQGSWDHIESILDRMGVPYDKFPENGVGQLELSKYAILFLNCGRAFTTTPDGERTKIQKFVDGGGALYVSDLAYPYIANAFPNAISLGAHDGPMGTRKTTIADVQLGAYLRGAATIPIFYDLRGWERLSKQQPASVLVLARDAETEEPAIVTWAQGKGFVGFTTFHQQAQMNEPMVMSLVYFITRM
jgi:hypothetical protein